MPLPRQQDLFKRRFSIGLAVAPLLLTLGAPTRAEDSAAATELKNLRLKPDGISLDFPRLADTGNAVPLRADIQAPAGLKVVSVEVILPENPNPSVLKLMLGQPQPSYTFTTRLRLAASQDAWVVVTLSDGSKRGASAPTIITSSACFDGT
jgi:predicted secreted protein